MNTFSNDGSFLAKFEGHVPSNENGDGDKRDIELPQDRHAERAENPAQNISHGNAPNESSKYESAQSGGLDGDNRSVAEKLRAKLLGKSLSSQANHGPEIRQLKTSVQGGKKVNFPHTRFWQNLRD